MDLDCCLPGSESSDPELLIPRQEDPTSGNFPNVLALTQGTERGVTQWRLHERLYCAVCQLFLEEPCWLHAKSIPNESVVPFALASLPNILCLDACTNSSTGKKVLAKHSIPPQTIFGPLVAATAEIRKESTVYAFPSPEDGQLRFFQLDSELFSNWMRYVRFAENPAEENLAVYLRGSQVVFVSLKAIFPGEELKVGYSAKYARTIGRTNRLSETQDGEGFCVAGVETVERNASALPQNLPKRTCAAVDTADWDFDSLETSLPGSTENVLLPTAPPFSANTVLSDPPPTIASSTKLDAVLTTVRPSLYSDAINKNSDCKKTAITHWVVADDLPVRREVQQRVPGQLKRKRDRPRKSDTVNKDDCRQQVKRELDGKSDTFECNSQETVKRKRGRPRKQPIVDQGGNLPLAAQIPKDLTVSHVKATSFPTSRASDAGGNAVLPAPSKSIDVPAVQEKTTREDSPEIDYHPAVWKTESPNKEQLVSTEFHSRRSTLRSAVKEGVLPVEKPAVPALDNCDDGEEVVLTGKGMGMDSDSDWAAEDGLVSDYSDEDDGEESEEDICDVITERKPGQNRGKRTKNKTQYSSNEMSIINGNDSTTTVAGANGPSSDSPTSANAAENSSAQQGAPVSRRKMEQKECPVCHRVVDRLHFHLNHEHPEDAAKYLQHACAVCGMRYHLPHYLRIHMTAFHPARGDEPTAESRQVAIEYMQKTGWLSYFCQRCRKYFPSKSVLDIHELCCKQVVEDHQARAERKCPACDFTGTSFGQLALHTADHAIKASERKQCLLCAEQVFGLSTHYQKTHPEYREMMSKDWQFECQQCGEKCLTQHALDSHMRFRHEKGQCIYCALQFESTKDLSRHLPEHQKDGSFPCPVCPRTFPQYAKFREHYRCKHDAKSVLVCEVCQAVCRSSVRLNVHMQSHKKDYRFPCTQCGKRFHAERYLRGHIRWVHEGNLKEYKKNYYAKRKEKEKQGLVEAYKDPRRKLAFEDFPYKCHECKLGYVRRSKLMHHVKAKHPDMDPHSVPL